ncbi:MAG TPA: DoxX family protein [Mycobacterium sp.]|nr:DoxX family protein [Mycobacterium sp.]
MQIAPIFVPLAAVGLALAMVGAAVVHSRRHEPMNFAAHAVLIALTAFGVGPYSFTPNRNSQQIDPTLKSTDPRTTDRSVVRRMHKDWS